MRKYLFFIILSVFILLTIAIYQGLKFNDSRLHLIFCSVGQGDAIFIKTPAGSKILIDGGPDDSVLNCLSRHMYFFDRKIDAVILTHPHSDHLTGLISVARRYDLIFYDMENLEISGDGAKILQDNLAVKNLTANLLKKGDRLSNQSNFSLEVLWPGKDYAKKGLNFLPSKANDSDFNGLSAVQRVVFGDFKALLTSDINYFSGEEVSRETGFVDILQVPHHGSKTGLSRKFLKEVSPKLAVISVGKNNSYGHPAKETLNLLKNNNVKVLRTDLNGDIEIISDGKTWEVAN